MKLPNRIFGIDTKEAYEKYIAESGKKKETKQEPEQKPITPANIQDPESYIILESRTHGTYSYPDILVSKEKSYHSQNWAQSQAALHQNNEFMLTIRQYADFLNLLKSGTAYDGKGKKLSRQELDPMLDEILTVRTPRRAEWLDAKFSEKSKKHYITYHKINPDGTLEQATKPLEDCLMQDRTPGIDLEYWLNNANRQGLPPKDIPDGKIWYYHPRKDYVVGFDADSSRVDLFCGRDPLDSDAALGVRVARVK